MSGLQEEVATCTGEQTDHGPAHLRQQTENGSSGARTGQLAAGGPPAPVSRQTADPHPESVSWECARGG